MRRVRADEDEYIGTMFLGIGTAHGVSGPEEDKPEAAGRLLVPDPEQRRGWREHYVNKPIQQKPGARPLGFRKP